jgi:hypothetical protein
MALRLNAEFLATQLEYMVARAAAVPEDTPSHHLAAESGGALAQSLVATNWSTRQVPHWCDRPWRAGFLSLLAQALARRQLREGDARLAAKGTGEGTRTR